MNPMKPTKLFTLSAVAALSSLLACSDDAPAAPEKKDVGIACSEMCRDSGFTTFKKDEQPNEVNCFCSVGPASSVVKPEACTKMCTSIGKGGGKPFGATATGNADSCQCE
jgi:hypothetical protein